MLRQARHGQDVARQGDDEAGTGAYAQLFDRDAEARRTAELRRVIRQPVSTDTEPFFPGKHRAGRTVGYEAGRFFQKPRTEARATADI